MCRFTDTAVTVLPGVCRASSRHLGTLDTFQLTTKLGWLHKTQIISLLEEVVEPEDILRFIGEEYIVGPVHSDTVSRGRAYLIAQSSQCYLARL